MGNCIFGGCSGALYHSATDLWGEDGEDVLTSPFESMGSFAWLRNDAMLLKSKLSILPKSELFYPQLVHQSSSINSRYISTICIYIYVVSIYIHRIHIHEMFQSVVT